MGFISDLFGIYLGFSEDTSNESETSERAGNIAYLGFISYLFGIYLGSIWDLFGNYLGFISKACDNFLPLT